MPIKKSLQNSILLMAVIPVILMAVFAYVAATTKYAEINTENIKNIAYDYSCAFSNQLKSQIIETTSLASSNELRNYLLEKVNTPDTLLKTTSANYNSVKASIEQISADFDNTVSYYIYDVDGYLVLSSSSVSSADWTEIMEQPVDTYTATCILPHSEFTQNTLDIISPIMVNNSIIGLIRTNITIDYFGTYLSTSDKQENFIIDTDGRPMFGYTIESHNTKLFENLKQLSGIGNEEISLNRILPGTFSDGMDYICGYSFVPDYNWLYVTIRDPSTYTNIVSSLPILLLVVLIIVTILSSQLSRSLAVKYTQPIIELSEKMQNAADGQLDVQCNMERDDEFGTLSNNFNQMMDIISTNYKEVLESRKALEISQRELQCSYEDIEKLAYTDALTGLYNRMAFFKYAQEILSNNNGKGFRNHAVIFIDLDGFKSINDTLGHDYGDLLLQAVSSKLSSFINKDDILARNGGDEFVILRNQINSREELEEFLDTLVSIASHPFVLEDETVHIT
ncbi:MAG: diguanylate cyclase, partial [Lachnospiraceae bacterium]|nr:diguanylate cyclase [Lachnospiraceae bacterium]